MSLILDALKKSDEAHRRGRSSKLESVYTPPPVPPRKPAHRYFLLIALALCLNAVLLVWWLRPWEPGVVAKGTREPAPAARNSVAQTTRTMQATQDSQPPQSEQTPQAPQAPQATQATQATQVAQVARATQGTQVPTPVDVSSDSAGKAGTGRDQGSGGSREQENQSRIAPAGSAGDEDEMKPEAATGEHGSETGLTVEAASGTDAASRQSATVSEPGPGEALAPADKAAAPVQVQEDVSREAPPPAATASAGPDPVPSETVAATTTAPLPARQVDTSRNATRAATAKVSEASPSGSAVGQDSPIVAGQTPLAVATAEPAPSTSTPRPARQAANPQKTASGQSAKVKEADLPGDSAGQSPPSVGGNIRPAMPQGERPSPEEFPRDTTPTEPARTAKQKPPGKAGKADDGGRNPSPGGGYPGQLGGSRELVSDLRSLMGADDSPKKAPSSGKVLKYYQLPSSIRDSLPKLSMSMLLHSKKSEERWVNINGAKVREGQEIASGLKVEEITPDGAIFTYKGQRFYKAVIGD